MPRSNRSPALPFPGVAAMVIAVAAATHSPLAAGEPATVEKVSDDGVSAESGPSPAESGPSPAESGAAPAESLAALVVPAGLKVELVASEPQIVDPVSIAFDAAGRMWVVEMPDYPTGPPEGEPHRGRIKVLQDREGEGHFETVSTFAEGLDFPTSVLPWRDGVILTHSGRLSYLADTTGDGRADTVEDWFEGFATDNTQLRANHPTLGPDGRIYVAGGLRGGQIRSLDARWSTEEPISIQGMDFAFDPAGPWCAAVPGNCQFGMVIDDFGNRFVCSNRNPVRQVVLAPAMLARSPWITPADAVVDVAAAGDASRVRPLIDAWTTSNLHAGQFTAACGVYRFEGTALPSAMQGDFFVCEPTGHLVQQQRIIAAGAAFTAERVGYPIGEGDGEFLASRDEWFRPVDLTSGPDGALYIVDMCRAVIEHPEWVPEELKQRPDERWGDDRGRIWRVRAVDLDSTQRPEGRSSAEGPSRGHAVDPAEPLTALKHPNRWHRQTATRLFIERSLSGSAAGDASEQAVAALAALFEEETAPEALARAAWLLDRLGGLESDHRRALLAHADPRLRALAVRLSARQDASPPDNGDNPWEPLVALATDSDPAVRFAVAVALVSVESREGDEAVTAALAQIARRDAADSLTSLVLSACDPPRAAALLQRLLAGAASQEDGLSAAHVRLAAHLARQAAAAGDPAEREAVLAWLTKQPQAMGAETIVQVAAGWLEGADRHGASARDVGDSASELYALAAAVAEDSGRDAEVRAAAVRLLRADDDAQRGALVRQLLGAAQPQPLRSAALATLAARVDPTLSELLLDQLMSYPPALRREAVDVLLRRGEWTDQLLAAIQAGKLPRAAMDVAQTQRLLRSGDADRRQRAGEVLAASAASRREVLQRYQKALAKLGSSHRGREVFRQQCASCHRIEGFGEVVGPDISDTRTQTPEQLLTAILDPNAAIDAGYFRYSLLTDDGRVIEGLLVEDAAEGVTLQVQGGERVEVPRDRIDSFQSSGVSMMPEGFEQQISPEAMADLIAYLKNWRYLDGAVPGLGE